MYEYSFFFTLRLRRDLGRFLRGLYYTPFVSPFLQLDLVVYNLDVFLRVLSI